MNDTHNNFLLHLLKQSENELPNVKFFKFKEYADSVFIENKLTNEELTELFLEFFPNSSRNSIFPLEIFDDLFFTNKANFEEKPYMAYFPEGSTITEFLIGKTKSVKMLYYEGMLFLYYVPFRQVFICVNYLRYKAYPLCYKETSQLCGMIIENKDPNYAYDRLRSKFANINGINNMDEILNNLLSIISPNMSFQNDDFIFVVPYRTTSSVDDINGRYVDTSRVFYKNDEKINKELPYGIKVFQYYGALFLVFKGICIFNKNSIPTMRFCMKQELLANNSFYGAFKPSK